MFEEPGQEKMARWLDQVPKRFEVIYHHLRIKMGKYTKSDHKVKYPTVYKKALLFCNSR
jgi:hypothetical protein